MTVPRPVGRVAWLLDCADGEAAAGVLGAVRGAGLPGLVHARRGATTVLVELATPALARAAAPVLGRLAAGAPTGRTGATHVLDVVYDGEDLASVAAELGLSTEALVAEHTGTAWRAEFCGFAPGFAYLSGWTRSVARLATPRTRVPAGAVGLAGTWSAAYPSDSPGGWRLIGRTDAPLWDADRDAPALVQPGDVVRWRAVRAVAGFASEGHARGAASGRTADRTADRAADARPGPDAGPDPSTAVRGLRVLHPGVLTLVEDLGRTGLEHLGVSPSGAADRGAARRANRAVGNPAGAAVLENVGGLEVAADGDLVVAVVGAGEGVPVRLEGRGPGPELPATDGRAVVLRDGERLRVDAGPRRCYLAVRGGVATPVVLGSRSADALGRLAWWPVVAGTTLPVGPATGVVGVPEEPAPRTDLPVRVVLGPRAERIADPTALLTTAWTVRPDSNRVGVRLQGGPLAWSGTDELASEPMVAGAIQVPAAGLPVVLLRDHPTTGGYPVVAVVVAEDLDRVAALAPGDVVRFAAVDA